MGKLLIMSFNSIAVLAAIGRTEIIFNVFHLPFEQFYFWIKESHSKEEKKVNKIYAAKKEEKSIQRKSFMILRTKGDFL